MARMTKFFLMALLGVPALFGDAWPQWLGPQRDGVWRETGILRTFPASGPNVVWRSKLHPGYSGPAVAEGKLVIMDRIPGPPIQRKPGERGVPQMPGQERILCLDSGSGRPVWEHVYDSAYRIDFPAGPRTTPLIVNDRVYTLGAMGDLFCLDLDSGKALWHVNFMEHFQLAEPPVWGWAAHPLAHEGKIMALAGGPGSAVAAFDAATGKELWRALTTREIGYAPPVIARVEGKDQLIVWHPEAVCGLNPATGEELWSIAYPAEGKPQRPEVTIATPRFDHGLLVLTSFYHGAVALKFAGEKPAIHWNRKSSTRSSFNAGLHTTMSTPAIKDGYLYGICGMGELRCLKAETGERVWETREHIGGKELLFGTSFLVEQDGRFFIWTDLGDLIIANLTPEKYEELGRAHLLAPIENARGRDVVWSHPAFANRKVYARNGAEVICVDLADKG